MLAGIQFRGDQLRSKKRQVLIYAATRTSQWMQQDRPD